MYKRQVCSYIDEDDDGDNIGDPIDKFPKDPTAWDDTDNDTMPDELTCKYLTDSANCTFELVEDLDDDDDGWPDSVEEACDSGPLDSNHVPRDQDGDGMCDLQDLDDDGDGVADEEDAFSNDESEWEDTDEDGVGNNADTDDDGDGWSDENEDGCGTDSLDLESKPIDSDGDGICDATDPDNTDGPDYVPEEPEEPEEDDSLPGFPAILATLALLGATMLTRHRRQ